MIVQCPACRALVAVEQVTLEPDRAGLVCGACGEVSWLMARGLAATSPIAEADAPGAPGPPAPTGPPQTLATPTLEASPTKPYAPPTTSAPAALATRALAAPEPALPLAAVRERLAALEPGADDDAVAEGFLALLSSWQDEAAHKRLLQQAAASGQLGALGLRYRAVLESAPEEPRAKKAQTEILTLAMASLKPLADGPAAPVGWRRGPLIVTILVIVGIMAFGMLGFVPRG